MKVRELIKQLDKQNPEQEVYFRTGKTLHAVTIVRNNIAFLTVELTNKEQDFPYTLKKNDARTKTSTI